MYHAISDTSFYSCTIICKIVFPFYSNPIFIAFAHTFYNILQKSSISDSYENFMFNDKLSSTLFVWRAWTYFPLICLSPILSNVKNTTKSHFIRGRCSRELFFLYPKQSFSCIYWPYTIILLSSEHWIFNCQILNNYTFNWIAYFWIPLTAEF